MEYNSLDQMKTIKYTISHYEVPGINYELHGFFRLIYTHITHMHCIAVILYISTAVTIH